MVIGASVGGVEVVCALAAALPPDIAATIFVVLHIGALKSILPSMPNEVGPMRAQHPSDGMPIHAGQIYVAPPDHHMLVEPGRVRLTRGPRENWARPAVDPLFRSAAHAYGAGVVGVILTGGLNDGTAGLLEVKRQGGVTVVQDPGEAEDPSMPRSALQHVQVHHCLPLRSMPALLSELVDKRQRARSIGVAQAAPPMKRGDAMTANYKLDEPVALICPDCGGALQRTEAGTLTQFRCHIRHVLTAEVMVPAQFAAMEWSLAAAMRSLTERGELCRQMGERAQAAGHAELAAQWTAATHEARERAVGLRDLLEREWTHPDPIEPQPHSGE